MGSSMQDEILPNDPLGAREWLNFVMVFWREKRDGAKGRVGFYSGESSDAYRILGGNQSDSVSLAWVAKERLPKARWPRTAASLGGGMAIVEVERSAEMSTAEAQAYPSRPGAELSFVARQRDNAGQAIRRPWRRAGQPASGRSVRSSG